MLLCILDDAFQCLEKARVTVLGDYHNIGEWLSQSRSGRRSKREPGYWNEKSIRYKGIDLSTTVCGWPLSELRTG